MKELDGDISEKAMPSQASQDKHGVISALAGVTSELAGVTSELAGAISEFGSKRTSELASTQIKKQTTGGASKTNKQASKQASKQAGKQSSKQASKQASRQASK